MIDTRVFRMLLTPKWLLLIIGSVVAAALVALWLGFRAEPQYTATTVVYGRRIGYLNRPLPVLDDHLNDIVNAVEFPDVFISIENRTLLEADDDYNFEITRIDDTDSVVQITVDADRPGDAERIARILAEEVVDFVLEGQEITARGELAAIDDDLVILETEQARIRQVAGGIDPRASVRSAQTQLVGIRGATDDAVTGTLEGEIQARLTDLRPLADQYDRNQTELDRRQDDRARAAIELADIVSSRNAVNQEWYRSISPVEPASKTPVAIAMAFAAGVPALLAAGSLSAINLSYRLRSRDELDGVRRPVQAA